jgi:hypothetical protein
VQKESLNSPQRNLDALIEMETLQLEDGRRQQEDNEHLVEYIARKHDKDQLNLERLVAQLEEVNAVLEIFQRRIEKDASLDSNNITGFPRKMKKIMK